MSSLLALRDRSIPWGRRLKNATQLYNNSTSLPFLPRKEQILIDWLTYSIHFISTKSGGEETWSEAESEAAWRLLADIFQSSELKQHSVHGSHIVLPLRFYKDVMTTLLKCNEPATRHVVSCLHLVCSLPCFKTFSYLSIDTLVELVSVCCTRADQSTDDDITNTLSITVTILVKRISQLTDKRNLALPLLLNMANKLFTNEVISNHTLTDGPAGSLLLDVMLDTFIQKGTVKHFDKFVKMKSASSESGANTNFVGVIFSTLQKELGTDKVLTRKRYAHVINLLFELFLRANPASIESHHALSTHPFGMLYFLLNMAGVMPEQEMLSVWAQLLKLAADYEIHSPSSDTSVAESSSLTKTLTDLLTKYQHCLTDSWYGCVSSLLRINHRCVEKQISRVLNIGWQRRSNTSSLATSSQVSLMNSLMETYTKMRQLPKLIKMMVENVLASPTPTPLPPQVVVRFGEVLTASPSSVCYEMWLSLSPRLLDLIQAISSSVDSTRCLVYADIVCNIMYHMKVYDSSVPLSIKHKLVTQILKVQTDLMGAIDSLQAGDCQTSMLKIPVFALLVDACSAVVVVLYRYADRQQVEAFNLQSAIALLDKTIQLNISPQSDLHLNNLIKLKLYTHRISLLELKSDDIMNSPIYNNCLSQILEIWSSVSQPLNYQQPWSNSVLDINRANIGTAVLQHVIASPLSTYLSMSAGLRIQFTRLLVGATFSTAVAASSDASSDSTMSRVGKFLHSWAFSELPLNLHQAMVEVTFARLSTALNSELKHERKKGEKRQKLEKCGSAADLLSQYFSCLNSCLNLCATVEQSDEESKFKRLYELTSEILGVGASPAPLGAPLGDHQLQAISVGTEILESVPLSQMMPSTALHTLPSVLLVLLRLLSSSSPNGKYEPTTKSVMKLLGLTLSSQNSQHLHHLNIQCVVHLVEVVCPQYKVGGVGPMVLAPLVKLMVTAEDTVFHKQLPYLTELYADFKMYMVSPSGSKSNSLPRQLFLDIVMSALQPRSQSRQVGTAVLSWATQLTKDVLTTTSSGLSAKVTDSKDLVSSELLLWLSTALEVKMVFVKMSVLTELVVKELGMIVETEEVVDDVRLEAMFTYLRATIAAVSTQPSLLSVVWRSVTSLSATVTTDSTLLSIKLLVNSLVLSLDMTSLSSCLRLLGQPPTSGGLNPRTVSSVVQMWRFIVACDSTNKAVIEEHCKQFVLDSHGYICWLSAKLRTTDTHCSFPLADCKRVLGNLLSLLADIASKGKAYCHSQGICALVTALHLIQFNKDVYRVDELIDPLSSMQRLLAAMLLHHQLSVNHNLSTYSSLCNKLVDTIITFSDQEYRCEAVAISVTESEILRCCQELHKVISLISDYPAIFGKVVSFMLADVIHSLQSVTLLPVVKKALYFSFNGLFDLLDEHSTIMLKTNLQEAGREIFKTMHSRWEKYHKYTGKV